MFKNQYDPSMSHAVCLLIKERLYRYIFKWFVFRIIHLSNKHGYVLASLKWQVLAIEHEQNKKRCVSIITYSLR